MGTSDQPTNQVENGNEGTSDQRQDQTDAEVEANNNSPGSNFGNITDDDTFDFTFAGGSPQNTANLNDNLARNSDPTNIQFVNYTNYSLPNEPIARKNIPRSEKELLNVISNAEKANEMTLKRLSTLITKTPGPDAINLKESGQNNSKQSANESFMASWSPVINVLNIKEQLHLRTKVGYQF